MGSVQPFSICKSHCASHTARPAKLPFYVHIVVDSLLGMETGENLYFRHQDITCKRRSSWRMLDARTPWSSKSRSISPVPIFAIPSSDAYPASLTWRSKEIVTFYCGSKTWFILSSTNWTSARNWESIAVPCCSSDSSCLWKFQGT